jgi:Tfp pilus assembly protein PilO
MQRIKMLLSQASRAQQAGLAFAFLFGLNLIFSWMRAPYQVSYEQFIREEQHLRQQMVQWKKTLLPACSEKKCRLLRPAQIKHHEEHLSQEFKAWPSAQALSQELTHIADLSRRTGLTLEHFIPMPRLGRDAYSELSIKMKFQGSYQQACTFIKHFMQFNPMLVVQAFKFERLSKTGINDVEEEHLGMELVVKLYGLDEHA